MEFEVTPDVLIPRPETEHLIEVALDRLAVGELGAGRQKTLRGQAVTAVDVGTGSGCLALALAKELPEATIHATDISEVALKMAQRNAARHGFADRLHFAQSNLLEFAVAEANRSKAVFFDLVICNPPYISVREADSLPIEVRDHEPHLALFGGEEGYELYGALVPQAAEFLTPGGLLVLELGYNSLPAVRPLFDTAEWTNIAVTKDLAGIDRVISAERVAPPDSKS